MDFKSNKYNDGFFNIDTVRGFLPINDPLKTIPIDFFILQHIIDNIPNLLKTTEDMEYAVKYLPNYIDYIKIYEENIPVVQTLFRAYTFLTSAYLLQPSHLNKTDSGYGKARTILPSNIAIPLDYIAKILKVMPFLDYHYAYALGNYKKIDESQNLSVNNLETICKFSGTRDETGFIMIHVNINQYSRYIINGINEFTNGNKKQGLYSILEGMTFINLVRSKMWKVSNSKNYNDFRAFIMGIKGNTQLFGEGVIYEGTDDLTPRQYRGQTGAQDDIIPTVDIFTGITKYYPDNELTKYLFDLRNYRPVVVQSFFSDLEKFTIDYVLLHDEEKKLLYNILEQIYDFRNGHWRFVHEYIMKNTTYSIATGGTPIISWIPNQINSVLLYMKDILDSLPENDNFVAYYRENISEKQKILDIQINDLKTNYNNDSINKSSTYFNKT